MAGRSRLIRLTARVTVNRIWQQFFGVGLVKTAEDFGTRGEWPSHPGLLDELALVTFRESGWDVKGLVRAIVMSKTYRQSSDAPAEDYVRDPENRLLSRGPRYRMDAEMIRDQILFVSGKLNRDDVRRKRQTASTARPLGSGEHGGSVHLCRRQRRQGSTAGVSTPTGEGRFLRRR